MSDSGASDLIVRCTADTVLAVDRLKVAPEHDLYAQAWVEQDPRFTPERVEGGDDLFADLKHPALDGFANWRAGP